MIIRSICDMSHLGRSGTLLDPPNTLVSTPTPTTPNWLADRSPHVMPNLVYLGEFLVNVLKSYLFVVLDTSLRRIGAWRAHTLDA